VQFFRAFIVLSEVQVGFSPAGDGQDMAWMKETLLGANHLKTYASRLGRDEDKDLVVKISRRWS
jgi:hypothetical protein